MRGLLHPAIAKDKSAIDGFPEQPCGGEADSPTASKDDEIFNRGDENSKQR